MEYLFLLILILIVSAFIYVYKYIKMATYIKSQVDDRYYLVRRLDDSQDAADLLAAIRINIMKVCDEAKRRYMNSKNEVFQEYINVLCSRVKNIRITENINNKEYTSYSIEKGEELVFCLRFRSETEQLHDINLLMYVVLHELAHIACPEYGHTPLFTSIFVELTKIAIDIGLYKRIDFKKEPAEYCGMKIHNSIV